MNCGGDRTLDLSVFLAQTGFCGIRVRENAQTSFAYAFHQQNYLLSSNDKGNTDCFKLLTYTALASLTLKLLSYIFFISNCIVSTFYPQCTCVCHQRASYIQKELVTAARICVEKLAISKSAWKSQNWQSHYLCQSSDLCQTLGISVTLLIFLD